MSIPGHLQQQLDQGLQLRRSSGYRGRYAPSPTGVLHRGNLQTALLSWLQARQRRGSWLLRIDDLDTPRNRPGAIEAIEADLRWLGLDWDGPIILQSRRKEVYDAWLSWLRLSGRLFACRCSRRQLAGLARYPGTCRTAGHHWGWQNQRLPSWRLQVPDSDPEGSGDVVLRRSDGFIAYQLATVLDELTLGITDVVRGEDLLQALPAQRSIYRALNQTPPRFHHGPLVCDGSGNKLSKREASAGLAALREQGMDAADVVGLLASGLNLVEPGSRLTARELLDCLTQDPIHASDS
mgnify:FL=1